MPRIANQNMNNKELAYNSSFIYLFKLITIARCHSTTDTNKLNKFANERLLKLSVEQNDKYCTH